MSKKKQIALMAVFFGMMVSTVGAHAGANEDDSLIFGDAKDGRENFLEYGCYACHQVEHDRMLPESYGRIDAPNLGAIPLEPKLRVEERDKQLQEMFMAIVVPSHTITAGYGKGSAEDEPESDMPKYIEDMTIREMRDIVAYLFHMDDEG